MATNQEARQASVRAVTSTAYTYNEDWMALFALSSITTGGFGDRMLAWINVSLSTAYVNINDAMKAYAVSQGATSWSEMGTFTPGGAVSTAGRPVGLLLILTKAA